jgi:hypothetical protein
MLKQTLVMGLVLAVGGIARAEAPPPDPQLQPATAPAAAALHSEEVTPNPPKKWGWAFGGVAVGSFILGGALGGAALARSNEQAGNPMMPELYTDAVRKRGEQGSELAAAGYTFIGLGVVAAVVDAVIWFEVLRKPRRVQR